MVAVLLCVTAAGAYLGSVVVARHRAQAAADLAALAGAARIPSGVAAACARAAAVAHAMRVDEIHCEADDLDVVVTVEVVVFGVGATRAAARAGPASASEHQVLSSGTFGSPAASSSSSEGNRNETRPAKVSGSSSTWLTVTCTGTQPPP